MTRAPRSESLAELLTRWLPGQRWFTAKDGRLVRLHRVGGLRLDPGPGDDDGTDEGVVTEILIVRAESADGARAVYQLPVTYRSEPEPDLAGALIGVFEHPHTGPRFVYDGPHDPAFVAALVRLLAGGRAAPVDDTDGDAAAGATSGGATSGGATSAGAAGVMARAEPPSAGPARVLAGEQSNTSIIVGSAGPDPMIVKLFRVLHPGPNPDVVVASRLAATNCDRVPRPVGWIEGSWGDGSGGAVDGHLAYACEFVGDGEDAWRVACRAVDAGIPFADAARELGEATAVVHRALAEAMPTQEAGAGLAARLADGLDGRISWAVGAVPALAPFVPAARRAVDAVRSLGSLPLLQQVHGDYHLGQVLRSPTRGWILLDFEGEPLRPLAERLEPDLALRDVAGMLRSFDYAARRATIALPPQAPAAVAAQAWSADAQEAFLAGYTTVATSPVRPRDDVLLRALEIDKAMYEVVYETLNRPSWAPIPMAALHRLTSQSTRPATAHP